MTSPNDIVTLHGQIPSTYFGNRLDQTLAELFPEYSRVKLKQWIESGCVKLNNECVTIARTKVKGGESVEINASQEVQTTDTPEQIPLDIIFEDNHILVINKPAGMVVHPGAGNSQGTLLNALLAHYPPINKVPRAGIVHRLDKDTTGLMVVAKTIQAQTHLVEQLQSRRMGREYEAIVIGQLIAGGYVDEPIGRHPSKRTLMAVRHTGKPAITHYRIIDKFRQHTHLRLKLETGRTHQIRVHMAHIKHPIVGDTQYAGRFRFPKAASEQLIQVIQRFKRQALHATKLTLVHPDNGEQLTWQVEIPQDMVTLLEALDADRTEHMDDML